jgi:subtilase family serine protease
LPASDSGWATEIALDVEWAHAIAPGANILLVEAKSAYDTDLDAALDYARNAPGVVVVSNSWGGSEYSTESSEDVHFTTPSGHAGVTFTVAAGDSGTGAEYPSSSPNVLSVGGTSLRLTSTNTWSSESVWSGGGGGASKYESVPSFQSGLGLAKRGTPDVSYDADPNTGFAVYDTYGGSGWGVVGGTSAGAPQWAALIAIADQGRALNGLGSLANAQSAIYSLSSADFHDVTAGSDGLYAAVGYDLASGRGSPLADKVIADLVAYGSTSTTGGGSTGTTGTTTLAAPQNVTATAASTTSAKLIWSSVSGASGYRILKVTSTQSTVVATVGSTATSATITGLTAGTTYTFKVEAYNSTATADSAAVSVTLPTSTTSTLAAPQNVSIIAMSSTSAKLSWTSVSGASGYRIFKVVGTTKTSLGTVSSTATSATITGLTAGSTDSFLVEAYNSTAKADSAVVTVTLPSSLAAPVVTATATSNSTALLSWKAVSGASGYRVYMWNGYQAVLLGTFGSSTTSVQVTSLTPGTPAQFLIEAYNSTQVADSSWVTVMMPFFSTATISPRVRH